jgi:hypothetical protein
LKYKLAVIEVVSVAIHSIVAGETSRAEGEQMVHGKFNVHLTMAIEAGVCCEGCDVATMTVITSERFTCRCPLMSI